MPDDLSALSYEAALAELDGIIARLERGDVELEAAISAYERGAALSRHCAQLLDRTEQKITQLVVGPVGEVERPFQPPAARAEPVVADPRPSTVEQRLFGEAAAVPAPRGRAVDPDDIPF
jgi:exodeoxyribonuclease VII small subunit